MALTAAQLLDELMGKDRNLVPGEKSSQVHWSHPDCCKFFLCGFCPSDLFTNTKADLGPCSKVHDEQLKVEYENSDEYGELGYEKDFIHFLSNIQADVERKIRRGHERLLMNKAREQELAVNDSDKVKMLTEHINQMLQEVEQLGSEGKVDEAQGVAKIVEQLKEEREQHKQNPIAGQEKQMEVCEVCGAFLIVGDAQSRVDDHLQGKQHMGYARIKSTLEDMKEKPWLKKKKERDLARKDRVEDNKSKKDRPRSVEKERSQKERTRERSRERSREKRRRSSSRSRDRRSKDRERRRSRERSGHRERSDRERSDRDRSDRDRNDRDRGDRDRSDRDRSDRDRSDRDKSDRDRSDRDRSDRDRRDRDRRDRDRSRDRERSRDRDSKRRSHRSRSRDRDSKRRDRRRSQSLGKNSHRSRSRERERDKKYRKNSKDRRSSNDIDDEKPRDNKTIPTDVNGNTSDGSNASEKANGLSMIDKENISDFKKNDIDTDSNSEMQLEEQNKNLFLTTFSQDMKPVQTSLNETEVMRTSSGSGNDSPLDLAHYEEETMYS
ncbi:luc7-like protein 3 [Hydra vulgaris]|uniref:luc7-like protein 3 n=1 Tax=Hydra vulgaris TaxID=6087 RepID=UPI001F5EDCED|nr:luc7-like protein 3 isoform X1 [Hydra vulgaris]XP_047142796.1 luc7-like protein 3 isoform X1 [Hydra vulgaris]